MTSRILLPEEWSQLPVEAIDPAGRVLVVEQDGEIIACAGLAWVLHAEDVWVHPDHRGKVGTVRALLRGVAREASPAGVRAVCVGVPDPVIADFVTRLGGPDIGPHAVLPLERFQ